MTVSPGYGPAYGQGRMLASTADRERALDVLKAGFAEGRLTQEEHEARAAGVHSARTYDDLVALTDDLPGGQWFASSWQPVPWQRALIQPAHVQPAQLQPGQWQQVPWQQVPWQPAPPPLWEPAPPPPAARSNQLALAVLSMLLVLLVLGLLAAAVAAG